MTKHTDKRYEQELKHLKEDILKMGGVVEEMISKSVESLVSRDTTLAGEVIKSDREANALEIYVDDRCLKLLALHQPAGSDLRFIIMGIRISKDLERMGDLAVNIAEQAIELNKEPQIKPYKDLPLMAEKTRAMVKDALDAFVKQDADAAQLVCTMDDHVDHLNYGIFDELMILMRHDPANVSAGVRLILIARQLERVADHATNIAEEVVFMVKGQDIRHAFRK